MYTKLLINSVVSCLDEFVSEKSKDTNMTFQLICAVYGGDNTPNSRT